MEFETEQLFSVLGVVLYLSQTPNFDGGIVGPSDDQVGSNSIPVTDVDILLMGVYFEIGLVVVSCSLVDYLKSTVR